MLNKTFTLYKKAFVGLSKDIWLLSLVTLINRTGAMVIPFLSIYLTQELNFTYEAAGMVMSCFGLGSVVGAYFGGWFSDRVGFYPVLFWSLMLTGLMFFVLSMVTSLLMICVVVFFTSAIADSFRPAGHLAIAAYSSPEKLTRSISLYRLAINLGFSMGPAIGGVLAFYYGYEWLFYADGASCIIAAITLKTFLKPKPLEEQAKENEVAKSSSNSPYKDKEYLWMLFFLVLSAVAFMQIFTTIPVYFKEHFEFNENTIGLLLALNGFLIVIIEMPFIYSLESRTRYLELIGIGALLIGISYVIFIPLSFWIPIVFFHIIAITFGEMLMMPFSNTYAVKRSEGKNRGQYMGLFTMAYSVSHIIAPTVGMFVASKFGFNILWIILTVITFIATFGFIFLQRKKQVNTVKPAQV
ncbi:MAG: MFS transporter [Bacteroidota bacterium]